MAGGASVQPSVSAIACRGHKARQTSKHGCDRGLQTLESEKGGHGVRLETPLEIIGGRFGDGSGAEQAGGRHPDVEPAETVQDLVDEDERLFLLGDIEGVWDDLGVGVKFGEFGDEGLVVLVTCGSVARYSRRSAT